jgi:hypothetical protein
MTCVSSGWSRTFEPLSTRCDILVSFRPPSGEASLDLLASPRCSHWVSLASAASEPLSVSAESGQRPWRLWRWSNERRVRSTALAVRLARAGAKLLATSLWLAYGPPSAFKSAIPADLVGASVCSNMRALLARSASRLRYRQRRRRALLRWRPSMASAGARSDSCLRPYSAQTASAGLPMRTPQAAQRASAMDGARHARNQGPSDAASGRRTSPQGGAHDVRQFAAGAWMYHRRTPKSASVPVVHGWTKGASAWWPFSLVTFSWPRKRKSHARLEAGGRDTDVRLPLLGVRECASIRPAATFPRKRGKGLSIQACAGWLAK